MISSSGISRLEDTDIKRNVSPPRAVPTCLKFKPVPLKVLQKELEEAENEPLPAFDISNNESETDDAEEEEEEPEPEPEYLALKPHNKEENSCDSLPSIPEEEDDVGIVSENNKENFLKPPTTGLIKKTPAKAATSLLTPNSKFLTPSVNRNWALKTPIRQRLATPAGTESRGPKIRCTINVSSYLNTPLTKVMSCQKPPVQQERSETTAKISENHRVVDVAPTVANKDLQIISVKGVEYIALNVLGTGGSSVVWNCFDPNTKSMRAIKKVNLSGDKNLVNGYLNEVKLLEKLQKCDRIIRLFSYEVTESEKELLMVLEKGDTDLAKILKDISSSSHQLPMYKLIYYWMEMLYAVKEIHDNEIIHSDLKPANLLQISSGLKLIDFGIASCIQSDMTSVIKNVPVGSFNYISPEALSNDNNGSTSPRYKVSYKSDVWSLGCILYQLVYRKTPFQHIGHPYAKMMAIADPKQQIKYPEAEGVPQFIINTIKSCLQYDAKSRPTVHELIEQMERVFRFE